MLKITIPDQEFYDENLEKFIKIPGRTVVMEHSLVSISKWESKWCKPFLSDKDKTLEETRDYAKCMTLTQNVPDSFYESLTAIQYGEINEYIGSNRTATTVSKNASLTGGKNQIVTSEVIYGWMVAFNIPMECQKWHLSRLMMLIEVCNAQQNPKKMGKKEAAKKYSDLNAQRLKQLGTKG